MRPIDADALSYRLEKRIDSVTDFSFAEGLSEAIVEIGLSPTVSPDEVRGVGRWVRISGFHLDHEYYPARYKCDQCEHFVDSGDDRNYCPNCGAKMEV